MLQVGLFVSIFLGVVWSVMGLITHIDNKKLILQRTIISDNRIEVQKSHQRLLEKAQKSHQRLLEKANAKHVMQIEIARLNTVINMAKQAFTENVDVALSLLGFQDASIKYYKDMNSDQIAAARVKNDDLMTAIKNPAHMLLLEQRVAMVEEHNRDLIDEKKDLLSVVSTPRKKNMRGYCTKCKTYRRIHENGNCSYCGTEQIVECATR